MSPRSYDPIYQDDPGNSRGLPSSHRPPVYYGEGPFDPTESSDEEDGLFEKPQSPRIIEAAANDTLEAELGLYVGREERRWLSVRWIVYTLSGLVAFAGLIGLYAALSYSGPERTVHGTSHITMDHIFNGTFDADRRSLAWVPEAGDGVYSIYEDGWVVLVDLKTNETRRLVHTAEVTNELGDPIFWDSWKLSADMEYVLVKTNHRKQWRHSSFGNYYIHSLAANTTVPLSPPTFPPVTAYATWSPVGQSIAFVNANDLYVITSPEATESPIRITSTGNATLFHGVPDWVYEEEVFSADYALWWSPDSSKLAYLSFDETDVPEYVFPVYNPTLDNDAVEPYTSDVRMRYPKPGYPNPRVSAFVFDVHRYLTDRVLAADEAIEELDWTDRLPRNDSVITEVVWADNGTLLLKEVNRNADTGSVVVFHLDSAAGARGDVVRKLGKDGEEGDDGWIASMQSVYPIQFHGQTAYLDVVPNADGYDHIALFSPVGASAPLWLTHGAWEVADGIQAVDVARGLVYFIAASPSSTERHLYSVALPTPAAGASGAMQVAPPTALTDVSAPGYHAASFSPQAGFYLLSYQGPAVPWQRVVAANGTAAGFVLTDNAQLNATWAEFEMPIVQYMTIENEGYELNAVELRPPHMDDSGRTKYPVLFRVYGGPQSQLVEQRFAVDWHYYLACALQYVVVVVDGRGTGLKGRKLRNPVKGNLGYWETKDQIEAARQWALKDYVDPGRIGIWGWSYGGYMSLKVVEADAGIHSLAMAVAPPTDWRMYDTIYTERYMDTPQRNPDGYANASVSDVSMFDKVDFALAHGSGDDNVHFANSAHLLDMFTAAGVRKYRFRMFTDSDHGIRKRGANRELFEWLTAFLVEKWGKGGRRRGW